MAITLSFVTATDTVTGTIEMVDVDINRILVANQTYLGTIDAQETVDKIIQNLVNELIGNTATMERNAHPVEPLTPIPPVSEDPGS